ncbi:MAG TPA: peptidylprolyl isomerase [Pirellulales bacterium]|jgi:parvulin-like peptidyl-prolyl isomerase|nr:peptidylprolyl isomerase [Pirellulales bacterium]
MVNRNWLFMLCLVLAFRGLLPAAAAEPAQVPAAVDDSPVVARVNGREIRTSEVQSIFASVIAEDQQSTLGADALAALRAEALAQLIDRRLVEAALSTSSGAVSAKDIDAALENVKLQLEGQHKTLDGMLAERRLTLPLLRQQLAWHVLWERAVAKHLTDKVLEDYFNANRRQFDGSEIRASHILFRPAGRNDTAAIEKLTQEAAALRAQIEAGKLTFAQAAERYSAAPSREQGGDVGFFPRHGLMVDSFAQSAFNLEKGQISQPVVTPFGVHLITVTDMKPGKKAWADVIDQLQAPAAKATFDKVAARERAKAKIEFTDAWPHFAPGTRELASPASGSR